MESYLEITLLHNILVNVFCLLLAHSCSFYEVTSKQIIAVLGLVIFSTFCFHPYAYALIIISELIILLILYRHREFLVFLSIGFRFILNLYFFYTVEGSIYNAQFFIAGEHYLWIEWSVLFFLILSLWIKGRIEGIEYFFMRTCYIEQIKCRGYLDSGNFLFVEDFPVIFLNQSLFDLLPNEENVSCCFQTVSEQKQQWGKKCRFSFDCKKWQTVICLPMEKSNYDCLIHMKGLRG